MANLESTTSESAISALQDLSARAHDGEQGYRRAAQDAADSDLKQQFEQLANERSSVAAELDRLIREHGGEPTWTSGSLTGAAHRLWVDLRSALSRNERQAILEEVARGESAAEEAYDDALRNSLPPEVRQVVREQHRRVREARNRYRAMAGTRLSRRSGELAASADERHGGGDALYPGTSRDERRGHVCVRLRPGCDHDGLDRQRPNLSAEQPALLVGRTARAPHRRRPRPFMARMRA